MIQTALHCGHSNRRSSKQSCTLGGRGDTYYLHFAKGCYLMVTPQAASHVHTSTSNIWGGCASV